MILNWHPNAERTSNGYFKNMSLKEGGPTVRGHGQGPRVVIAAMNDDARAGQPKRSRRRRVIVARAAFSRETVVS